MLECVDKIRDVGCKTEDEDTVLCDLLDTDGEDVDVDDWREDCIDDQSRNAQQLQLCWVEDVSENKTVCVILLPV